MWLKLIKLEKLNMKILMKILMIIIKIMIKIMKIMKLTDQLTYNLKIITFSSMRILSNIVETKLHHALT